MQRDKGPVLTGRKVWLRQPESEDYEAWAALRQESQAFLTPFEPRWADDELSREAYRKRLRFYERGMRDGSAYSFFLLPRGGNQLLGGLTLSNIRHGVISSCSLGYWIGEPHARRGYMSDAVRAVLPFVFESLRLHRLEAACLVSNEASIRLLRGCGFTEEGMARKYLRINSIWQDHLLFALLTDDR